MTLRKRRLAGRRHRSQQPQNYTKNTQSIVTTILRSATSFVSLNNNKKIHFMKHSTTENQTIQMAKCSNPNCTCADCNCGESCSCANCR